MSQQRLCLKQVCCLFLSIFLITSCSQAQSAYIIGPTNLNPGDNGYYTAQFDYQPLPYSNIYWSVTGGTVISSSSDPYSPYCEVQWDNAGCGNIQIYEDIYGQFGSLNIQVGSASIYPTFQNLSYGSTVTAICVNFGSAIIYSYQWQQSDDGISNWTDISGATYQCYSPPAAVVSKWYRCIIELSCGSFFTEVSAVLIPDLDPGIISANQQPTYNSTVVISNTPATGGFCYSSNYQYTWEQSFENGPWIVIGNGQNYPIANPVITGRLQVRRKITCGTETLYSNTLDINPQYTTVDYENLNYVRENTVLKRGVMSWYEADALPIGDKLQSTNYLDGLGRPIQTVDKKISTAANSTWNDIVKPYEYDAVGRSIGDFLPYSTSDYLGKFKPNAKTAQSSYITTFFGEPSNAPTYSSAQFDNSPLNRVMKEMKPGSAWGGANIGFSMDDDFNNSMGMEEKVHIWDLAYSSSAMPSTSPTQTYTVGKLIKTISFDEKQKQVVTYTDFSGKVILTKTQFEDIPPGLTNEHSGWACTYYVYDDFGKLRFIITPKAVDYLDTHSWVLTQEICDELCYQYLYDKKGRLVVKKQPGVGSISMVYDKKNRVVLTQHANQLTINNTSLTTNQWSFMLYDDLNRTIATGLLSNNNDRLTMQNNVDNLVNAAVSISAFVGNSTYQTVVADNPVAGSSATTNYLPGNSNIIFNVITHFGNYGYTGVKTYQTNNTFAYSSSDPNIEPSVTTIRTNGMVTGQKVRILTPGTTNYLNDKFIFSSFYYDESERLLQTVSDNVRNGVDFATNQYDFSDKLMSTFSSHNNGSTTYTITSKQEYDQVGRPIKLSKNFNNTFYKLLAEYSYDELGNLKTKRLAPGYTGTGHTEIESQTFTYNIQGWLTGINKDWALSNNNYTQWDNFFGLYIGYTDNNNFSAQQYNGNPTGSIWRSQGDNNPRKFNYEYDNLNRFTKALFSQKTMPSDGVWSSTETDFSTYVEYADLNGNISRMKHFSVLPGINMPIVADDLHYSYIPLTTIPSLQGNKLQQVDDWGSLGSNNGKLGDFNDVNLNTQDYYYDVNGNLVKDLNKNIKNGSGNGVVYDFLNKPEKIIIENKSTVEFTYDAKGEKLSKKLISPNGDAITTYFINEFVYQTVTPSGGVESSLALQFILHEEGRLKVITPHTIITGTDYELNNGGTGISLPGGLQGVFDYFIRDNLGNVRMVLTEEYQKERYTASMDQNAAGTEEQLFGKVNPGPPVTIAPDNELANNRYLNSNCLTTPWPGNCTDFVKLTAVPNGPYSHIRGPNLILKVMAGDMINAKTDYYYQTNQSQGQSSSSPLTDIINSLVGAILGNKTNEITKVQASSINTSLNNSLPFQAFMNAQAAPPGPTTEPPKAYLNIVFFDEQFKFVEPDVNTPGVGSGRIPVSQNNAQNVFLLLEKKAPKNGWVFIYLSNESNETVYFDNFVVNQTHSQLSEESHYYPFGLKIASISSRAYNKLENRFTYQGLFSEQEPETGWDEFNLRMYDPQIGRWTSADPYDEFSSPYIAMGNNPLRMVDPTGGLIKEPEIRTNKYGQKFIKYNGKWIPYKEMKPVVVYATRAKIKTLEEKDPKMWAELLSLFGPDALSEAGAGINAKRQAFIDKLTRNGNERWPHVYEAMRKKYPTRYKYYNWGDAFEMAGELADFAIDGANYAVDMANGRRTTMPIMLPLFAWTGDAVKQRALEDEEYLVNECFRLMLKDKNVESFGRIINRFGRDLNLPNIVTGFVSDGELFGIMMENKVDFAALGRTVEGGGVRTATNWYTNDYPVGYEKGGVITHYNNFIMVMPNGTFVVVPVKLKNIH